MRTILYPGTFDPVTKGHMDLVERGCRLFDRVIVGVAAAHHKETPLFTVDERVEMASIAASEMDQVEVRPFDGLLVDFAREVGAAAILRGLRAISDYEFETQMAFMNRKLAPELEILFLPADERYTYVSSAIIKEIARLGGDIARFVPPVVIERLGEKLGRNG